MPPLSVSAACKGEVEWISFQSPALAGSNPSFRSDDMREKRKDGCQSAVLEPFRAFRCPTAHSSSPAHAGFCLLSFSQAYLSSLLQPNLLQRCNSIKACNQYTQNCIHLSFFERKKSKYGKWCVLYTCGCLYEWVCLCSCPDLPNQLEWNRSKFGLGQQGLHAHTCAGGLLPLDGSVMSLFFVPLKLKQQSIYRECTVSKMRKY